MLLKHGNTAWQADGGVPVTQSSYTWSKWTGWAEPIPNASDFKVGISLVDTCAAQVGGVCPSANISIIPSGGIDYSDGYFMVTTTPPTTAITANRIAPTISSIATANVTSSGVTITWTTNEPADSQVEYGLNNLYGNLTTLNMSLVTNHSVTLTGLNADATYHYRVKSKDIDGYYGDEYSTTSTGDYTFITLAASGSSSTDTIPNNASAVTGYVSGQIVNLQWNDNSSNETGFDIYRRSSGLNVTPGTWTRIIQTSNNATTYADSPGTGAWEYRVDACNSAGCASNSGTVQLTVQSITSSTANCFVKVNNTVIKSVTATDRNDCYNQTSFGSQNCSIYDPYFATGSNLLEQYFGQTDRVNSDTCVKSTSTTASTTAAVLDSLNGLLMKIREFLRR